MKICIVIGTRPEIIKMSPIIKICENMNIEHDVIHTQQHYSYNIDKIIFQDLEIKYPKITLDVKSGESYIQISKIIKRCGDIFRKNEYDYVLLQGDTNSVLGAALAAQKCGIKIGHVEAGLRSFDRSMPEEINRLIADSLCDLAFCPTNQNKKQLLRENIEPEKIFVVGNTIADALYNNNHLYNNVILEKYGLSENNFILATLHRPANVDSPDNLMKIIKIFSDIVSKYKYPLIFPIHPRTKQKIQKLSIDSLDNIILIDPIGYFDFISLLNNSKLILTDSGGIQEEACILKKPCITLRKNTERPETLEVGANILTDLNREKIFKAIDYWLNIKKINWKNPFGTGNTSKQIIDILIENI